MSTAEAAVRLAVSPQRVRALWHEKSISGRIIANRLLLDRVSVLDLADRDRLATRPLSARNAWTLLLMLSGESSPWSSSSEVSRLRGLIHSRNEKALAALVRARSETIRLDGITEVRRYVLRDGDVVPSGATLAVRWTDLVIEGATEVYATRSTVQGLVDRFRLWEDPRGQVVLHAVPDALGRVVSDRAEMPASVVAVDLLENIDPRSHRAGEELWAQLVGQWRSTAGSARVRHRKKTH